MQVNIIIKYVNIKQERTEEEETLKIPGLITFIFEIDNHISF
jgi:hypothetical protein